MPPRMTDARRALERAKQAAQDRLAQLDQEKREVKASIKSLQAALKALGAERKPSVPDAQPSTPPNG